MPSLMTCSLIYQLSVTPELRRHLRLFNNNNKKQEVKAKIEGENRKEISINIKGIYELKQQQHQQLLLQKQQKSQKDCLQKILKKTQKLKQQQQQHKRRRWVLSCNLITILKQIKLTNPTFDIQQQKQQQKLQQHCQKPQLQQQQQQQYLLKI